MNLDESLRAKAREVLEELQTAAQAAARALDRSECAMAELHQAVHQYSRSTHYLVSFALAVGGLLLLAMLIHKLKRMGVFGRAAIGRDSRERA